MTVTFAPALPGTRPAPALPLAPGAFEVAASGSDFRAAEIAARNLIDQSMNLLRTGRVTEAAALIRDAVPRIASNIGVNAAVVRSAILSTLDDVARNAAVYVSEGAAAVGRAAGAVYSLLRAFWGPPNH